MEDHEGGRGSRCYKELEVHATGMAHTQNNHGLIYLPTPTNHNSSYPSSVAAQSHVESMPPKVGNEQNRTANNGGSLWWTSSSDQKSKMKIRRKMREPRFCFQTRSDLDVLDDGYKWRKYGQKVVKNSLHPRCGRRSYYRCTHSNCRVKKRIERLSEDCRMVVTTYEGRHTHSPSQDSHSSDNDCFTSF